MKYDKLQKTKAETAGFTLVEIVAVLVLLGILAAVAVPKFFDLSSDAEKKAAEAALMEAQVRINAGYSKAVYAGKSCEDAVDGVSSLAKIGDGGKNIINGYTLTLQDGDQLKEAPGSYVTLTKSGKSFDSSTFDNLKQIFKPTCNKTDSGTSSDNGLVCPDGSGGNGGGNTDTPSCPETKCNVQLTCVNNKVNYSCSCTGNGSCEPLSDKIQLTCSNDPSGEIGDFVNPFVWDGKNSCEDASSNSCAAGTVFIENGKYYYLIGEYWGLKNNIAENPGLSIEETEAFKDKKIVGVSWPAVSYDAEKNRWSPLQIFAGNVFQAEDGKWYGCRLTDHPIEPELPPDWRWVELRDWN